QSPPPNPFLRTDQNRQQQQQPPRGPQRYGFGWGWVIAFLVLLVVNILITNVLSGGSSSITIPYTEFKAQVTGNNVQSVTVTGDQITGHANVAITAPGGGTRSQDFQTVVPTFANGNTGGSSNGVAANGAGDNLEALLESHHVEVTAQEQQQNPLLTILLSFGPTLLLIGGFILLSRYAARATGGAGIMGFGRSTAKLVDADRPQTTFADVAGIDDAKQELEEVVDFLRDPQKYQRLGGTVPKGVLLIGAPGTGKTLLARAVAGEARVPFLTISASEFVEAIVGVGAARVRDLFKTARSIAPAIVFIDELDAVGRSRATQVRLGGHDEQEQTLNQILTEMDGFDSREGVIVIAATNRPDVLDEALLRPGRFDRRVVVSPPDREGRAAILRVHTRGVTLAKDVDLDSVAQQTTGLVGADLRNLVNEAALLGARRNQDAITTQDFSDALEKIQLGTERHIVLTPDDRRRIAYHESGHALLGLLIPGSDPVRRVSIVPRGQALGATVSAPVNDRMNLPEDYLRGRITSALGGRAAESIVYGVVTTGAENDLMQVTRIAYEMVTRWGMSDKIGPINFGLPDGNGPLPAQRLYSDATAQLIDAEVHRIVDECHQQACTQLERHRKQLDDLVEALLVEDTLDQARIIEITGISAPAASARPRVLAHTAPDARGSG
ncbi:MAG: ATP-dependent zinc metalloprotease FtsH, partial [Candidatus Dormibacteraeota bacterium]|nr:ATP-dependent zinc metalloprotease FtsH [Candidatus Dormibacteraeota bacterium]